MLVVSADETTVQDNEIRLGPAPAVFRPLPQVVDAFARFVGSHVETVAVAGLAPITLPGNRSVVIRGASQVQRLAQSFATVATEKSLARATPRQALQRFVRRAVLAPESLNLSVTNSRFLAAAITSSRAVGQGIVIGGSRADLVRIAGNVLTGVICGVHVGLSGANAAKFTAGEVDISHNAVRATVPFFWNRTRHAYYVGSVGILNIHDNTAILKRIGATDAQLASITPTPVEAVRIYGRLGPWLSTRGLVAGNFTVGVAITSTGGGCHPRRAGSDSAIGVRQRRAEHRRRCADPGDGPPRPVRADAVSRTQPFASSSYTWAIPRRKLPVRRSRAAVAMASGHADVPSANTISGSR